MALNSNHTFEELEGIKCSVVEKKCSEKRVEFLRKLLELNEFTVVVVRSLPPKTIAKPAAANIETPMETPSSLPATFTIGVTDLSFNPVNAAFNRELKTMDGKVVTPGYWKQSDVVFEEDLWYWKR